MAMLIRNFGAILFCNHKRLIDNSSTRRILRRYISLCKFNALCKLDDSRDDKKIDLKKVDAVKIAEQNLPPDDFAVENERRIAEILEYYDQYEKEIVAGGYQDPQTEPLGHVTREETYIQDPVVELRRGRTGVFDLREVVAVLRHERARDICSVKVPPEAAYTDHIVVCTAFNVRHANSICQYFYWLYKRKKSDLDESLVKVDKNSEWSALDFGNVVVHVMTEEIRRRYDVEMLWAVGPEFDDLTVTKSETDILEEKLHDLQSDIDFLKNVKVKTV